MEHYQSVTLRHRIAYLLSYAAFEFIGNEIASLLNIEVQRKTAFGGGGGSVILTTRVGNSIRFGNDFLTYAFRGDYDEQDVLKAIKSTLQLALILERRLQSSCDLRFKPNLVTLNLLADSSGIDIEAAGRFFQRELYIGGEFGFVKDVENYSLWLGDLELLTNIKLAKKFARASLGGNARMYNSLEEIAKALAAQKT